MLRGSLGFRAGADGPGSPGEGGRVTGSQIESRFIGRAAPGSNRAGAGGWPCQGMYYTAPGDRPRVALIATHYSVDFTQHYLAERIAARGIGFLGWNTRFRGNDAFFLLDQ